MPRKRMLDPEFWNDSELGAEHSDLRLLYEATWTEADDEGRLLNDVKRLHRLAFGYNKKISTKRTEFLLGRLINELRKLRCYSVNGKDYLFVKNFFAWQTINRPTPSRLPPPPANLLERKEDSLNLQGGLTPKLSKYKLIELKLIEVSNRFPIYKQVLVEDVVSLKDEFPFLNAEEILGDLLVWEKEKNKGNTVRPLIRLRNFFKKAEERRKEREAKDGKVQSSKYSGLEE